MNKEFILNLFYTKIIPEASIGKVDCFFTNNIIFNLVIENHQITQIDETHYEGILIPTLKITDKEQFDELLSTYVNKALSFYDKDNFKFLEDIKLLFSDKENLKTEYLIKYIICTLFANATFDDFSNPLSFLEKRIAMLENNVIDYPIDYGDIDSINASLTVRQEKSPIKAETPYRLIATLKFSDGYRLQLPEIYVGKSNDKYVLYGIQKTNNADPLEERPYLKNIRKGLIAKINGAPEHYFLAVMIFLSLCNDLPIEVSPFLVERWNAKRIAMINRNEKEQTKTLEDIQEEQSRIQKNITDIFIRYFTKLEDVTEGLNIDMSPFEMDSNLHISIDSQINSRSELFNEIYSLSQILKSLEKENNNRKL